MSFPFTQRYAVHLLPTGFGLSPTFGTFKRADTGANVSSPTIFELGGAGNGQGWYFWDWTWNSIGDPDLVYTFEGTTPYDPSTAWLDSLSAIDVVPVAPGPAASRIYEFHFQPTDTGLTPAFALCKRLDTGADIASPPAIVEIGGGFYRFSWPFQGSTDPDVVFLINGNAPGAIDPSKAWYGRIRTSDQYAASGAAAPPPGISIATPNPLIGLQSTTDFGQDFSFLSQLDPNFGLVSGPANLGQALAHRLETPRGSLFYDPNYGTDIRDLMNDHMTPAEIAEMGADAQAECSKDERVLACVAQPQFDNETDELNLNLSVQTASGPFLFVMGVNETSVSLLSASA